MRLGMRWRTGEAPHRSVPEPMHAELAAQEALHPDAEYWTLTWLEGRPCCALDDLLVVGLDGVERLDSARRGDAADDHLYSADEAEADLDDWLD